jgi:hypothetical protein
MAEEDNSIFAVNCRTDGNGGPYIWIVAAVNNRGRSKKTVHFNGFVDLDKINLRWGYAQETIGYQIDYFLSMDDLDIRHPIKYESSEALLNAFWQFYLANRGLSLLVIDYKFYDDKKLTFSNIVNWNPDRMFDACIDLDRDAREDDQPHAWLDLSTLMFAKGHSPAISRSDFIQKHNCSLVPNDWATFCLDPLREALTTLSVANYLLNIKK